jgi:competence ComEA-like helix-hairpin-helix protein
LATAHHNEKQSPGALLAKVLLFSLEWLDWANCYHLFMDDSAISRKFPTKANDKVEHFRGDPLKEDQRPMWVFLFVVVLLATGGHNAITRNNRLYNHEYRYLKEKHKNILYLEAESQVGDKRVSPAVSPLFFLPLPINNADVLLLQTIPGIGPGIATRIVQYRQEYGPLQNLDDLLNIPGIGTKRATAWAKQLSFESFE